MAISTVTNRVEYQGNGTSAVFAFPYRIDAQSHLSVFIFNSSGQQPGVITPLVLNTDYTFSGTANGQGIYPTGGNIIINSTPNAQANIVMFRSSVVTNAFLVPQFGGIPATSLNNEIDYLTMLLQREQDLATRSIRLQDGQAGAFDTTLPSNIFNSAGKRLIVNSSATGWTFDETLGSYIPNTIVYAQTNSSISSLGGDIGGKVLMSQGSSAPSWNKIDLSSNSSVFGVAPTSGGGTGTGSNFQPNTTIIADPSGNLTWAPGAVAGLSWVSNGSSAPSWQAVSLAGLSGILPVPNGGTGTASAFFQGAMMYAGSSGAYVALPAYYDGVDTLTIGSSSILNLRLNGFLAAPLRTSATGVLVSGSTNMATEVVGTLATLNGGTGTGANYTQYGVIYASSATQMATAPSATAGFALIANGSSAPSFQAVAVTNAVATKTATYTVTSNDRYINLNNSSFTINLTAAFAVGKEITLRQVNSSTMKSNHFIVGSGVLINGIGSTTIQTYGEQLDLTYDGTGWFGKRTISNQWFQWDPLLIGFGSSVIRHSKWRRVGSDLEIDMIFKSAICQAVNAFMNFPGGTGANGSVTSAVTGSSTIGTTHLFGQMITDVQTANNDFFWALVDAGSTGLVFGLCGQTSTNPPLARLQGGSFFDNTRYSLKGSCQIAGWESN